LLLMGMEIKYALIITSTPIIIVKNVVVKYIWLVMGAKMKREKAVRWIVLVGRPIFSSRTRKQARKFIKEHEVVNLMDYHYVGKVVGSDERTIILDV